LEACIIDLLATRELELLSRPLTPDEAREVMNMARRIAAIVLLEPALDVNYQTVKADTYSWPAIPQSQENSLWPDSHPSFVITLKTSHAVP
jgi:hypothetical protein